jgi:hypothetical protein
MKHYLTLPQTPKKVIGKVSEKPPAPPCRFKITVNLLSIADSIKLLQQLLWGGHPACP